ncbi:structural maintenance of chromosomes protein (SMC) [Vairimorpha necatrix]|uniref:Structural maintenance of chromosomes protein (SMC) n=1 Tax=Vairimorpha necatrix TaxID=6039 RepID=A0AAX4JA22_9MICR
MFLQKIEIENFKSFKSFTSIDFSPEKSIIIGKNGSGKSNIIHAINTIISCKKLSKEDRIDLINENKLDLTASISLFIDNSDLRLDTQKQVKITRKISPEKDEYFLNDKLITRKDLLNTLENGGISSLGYFIVQQGKINELINISDINRYELIRNLSGAQKYEQEREHCIKMLNEAEITKKKFSNNMKIINDKLGILEKEKEKMTIYKNLEREKRRYEIAYNQKELEKINKKLGEIEEEEEEGGDEDVEYEIRKINEKIQELENEKMTIDLYFKNQLTRNNYINNNETNFNENELNNNENEPNNIQNNKDNIQINKDNEFNNIQYSKDNNENELNNKNINKDNINYDKIIEEKKSKFEKKLTNLKEEINKNEKILQKYKNEEKDVFINKMYLKNVINYLKENKEINKEEEIKHTQELLEEKRKFIKENKSTGDIFNFETLNKMIEKRKELWREEKKLNQNHKNLEENIQNNENKLITTGNYSYKICKDMINKGIIGCVFDIFDIPDELIPAFEAVSGKFLFNLVVKEDSIIPELIKKVPGSVTFIPLNKMINEENKEIKDEEMYLLSSKITISETDATLQEELNLLCKFITKNFYVVKNLEKAEKLSKKYKINTVTLEGDLIRKNGIITGGYDNKSSIIREFKKIKKQKNENKKKLENLKSKISKLNFEIETLEKIQKQNEISFSELDLMISIKNFLEEKILILKNKGKKIQHYESKLENISFKYLGIKSELIKIENLLEDLKKEKEEIDQELQNLKNFVIIIKNYKNIENLRNQEDLLKRKFKKYKKNNLILKREKLINQIGINTEILYNDLSEIEITEKLKNINEELKKYIFVNKRNLEQWNIFIDQKNDILKRFKELEENYETINKFIRNIDEKKNVKMNLTFESVKENFEFFSKKLCNFEVRLENNTTELKINVNEGDDKNLSGGQKTMVAIALIFSIQKVDPSPFYIFDEVDANLDEEGRMKLAALFQSLNDVQFIMTTFRSELLSVGNKFIGVSYSEKTSYASEVEKEIAGNFLMN